jgi:hypothetical protein
MFRATGALHFLARAGTAGNLYRLPAKAEFLRGVSGCSGPDCDRLHPTSDAWLALDGPMTMTGAASAGQILDR